MSIQNTRTKYFTQLVYAFIFRWDQFNFAVTLIFFVTLRRGANREIRRVLKKIVKFIFGLICFAHKKFSKIETYVNAHDIATKYYGLYFIVIDKYIHHVQCTKKLF